MIKKVIGMLAAVAVIVVITFATMHRDKYRSMLEERAVEQTSIPATPQAPAAPAALPDSVAALRADSIQ